MLMQSVLIVKHVQHLNIEFHRVLENQTQFVHLALLVLQMNMSRLLVVLLQILFAQLALLALQVNICKLHVVLLLMRFTRLVLCVKVQLHLFLLNARPQLIQCVQQHLKMVHFAMQVNMDL
jgi:hypothetical protein